MMKVRKDELLRRIKNDCYPCINMPYLTMDQSPNSTYSMLKTAIETAIKNYVDQALEKVVQEIYTTEEFEADLGLDKPR